MLLSGVRFLFLFAIFLFPSVSAWANETTAVVAFAQDTMQNDFRKAQVFEVRDAVAKHPQLSFVYSDAQGQTSLMVRQIENFISQKVDVLVVGASDENALVPVISRAHKAGIAVIILDRGIRSTDYTTFIDSDNIKIGALGGEYIAKRLNGKGVVLLLEGIQSVDVTRLRSKGFIDEISKYEGIEVIKRTGNYLRKDAVIEMEKLIAEGIKVDAIFSESDSMLSGVRMVLERYDIAPGSIVMVGCDYISEARDAIREGTQAGSILFPLGGKMAVEVALKILAKKSVPKHISIPVQLITKENVEDVSPIF